ncbi:MAG: HEPN domain-containing protein [SAR324 cluster bacterium]|nr:HEPN domain-containing protein [SAR324 cluster bacterium]
MARKAKLPSIMNEILCFHAQQAVEKAIKALLIKVNIDVPRTHNLRTLLDKISPVIEIPTEVDAEVILTDYAVSARYPGEMEEVTDEDYETAIELAQRVLDWARGIIEVMQNTK